MIKKLILLVFLCNQVSAQESGKSYNDGFAFQAGAGTYYGGFGLALEYQFLMKEKAWITPHAGIGLEIGAVDISGVWTGYSFGVNLEYGTRHRFISGLSYGTYGVGYDTYFPNPADSTNIEFPNRHVLIGPAFLAGYKGVSPSGIIWQAYIGGAYMKNPESDVKTNYFAPTFGVGAGYKF
jgi:hypothetical protein